MHFHERYAGQGDEQNSRDDAARDSSFHRRLPINRASELPIRFCSEVRRCAYQIVIGSLLSGFELRRHGSDLDMAQ
jgi:hypothetical protein